MDCRNPCSKVVELELENQHLRSRVENLATKLRIARAAGRRLGEYWRAQTNGAEGINELLVDNWRSKIGEALGLDMPLLSEQIEAINRLKEENAASRDGRARAERENLACAQTLGDMKAREARLLARLEDVCESLLTAELLPDPMTSTQTKAYLDGKREAVKRFRAALAGEKGGA